MTQKALILVDVQKDFCFGGALAVPHADEIVPLANQLQAKFDLIIATKDWHPKDHMSFAINHANHKVGDMIIVDDLEQILWPAHCVQESPGSTFHPGLKTDKISKIFYKGIDKQIDSYSAFYDNAHKRATGLHTYLQENNVHQVYILGLATDYCVKYSCLDAVSLGFDVYVIIDACRGVELHSGDTKKAIDAMQNAGVHVIQSDILLS